MATLLTTSCNTRSSRSGSADRKVITIEEVRLWSAGRIDLGVADYSRSYVVGKITKVGTAEDGSAQISFAKIDATFSQNFARDGLSALAPGQYVVVDCNVEKAGKDKQPLLYQCDRVQKVRAVTANGYETSYARNTPAADRIFKGKYTVVEGTIYAFDKLTTGEKTIELETRYWGADDRLYAFMSADDLRLAEDYYKLGDRATMLCLGGWRWNPANSIGLRDCHVLGKY